MTTKDHIWGSSTVKAHVQVKSCRQSRLAHTQSCRQSCRQFRFAHTRPGSARFVLGFGSARSGRRRRRRRRRRGAAKGGACSPSALGRGSLSIVLSDDKKKGLEKSISDFEPAIVEAKDGILTLKDEIDALLT